jgi:ferredoxin--NADP+ reductase
MTADKYTEETITSLTVWADHLFSFRLTRQPSYRFIAGQFARLGVRGVEGDIVWRPYSMVSATYDDYLEFYSIIVPDGLFTQRLAQLKVGDTVLVDKTSFGFLTTDRFEAGKDLWLLSTGTGLAPFISILYDFKTWEDYEHIILVHSVRHHNELAYEQLINSFKEHEHFADHAHKLIYQQLVSREQVDNVLHGRITTLLENGELEQAVGFDIDKERARIMICGNPNMVADTRKLLMARGLTMTRSAKPGNIAVENYW